MSFCDQSENSDLCSIWKYTRGLYDELQRCKKNYKQETSSASASSQKFIEYNLATKDMVDNMLLKFPGSYKSTLQYWISFWKKLDERLDFYRNNNIIYNRNALESLYPDTRIVIDENPSDAMKTILTNTFESDKNIDENKIIFAAKSLVEYVDKYKNKII